MVVPARVLLTPVCTLPGFTGNRSAREEKSFFDDIETGIAETRVELDKPVPNTATLHANESRFRRIQATIKDWLKKAALGGLVLAGDYVGEKFLDRAWEQLGTVSEAISALVAVLPGF